MTLPLPPFAKVCSWCKAPFLATHSTHRCCSQPCREKHARRRQKKWWRKFYRANHERLLAYYAAHHVANREARNARQRERNRRRRETMTEAERIKFRETRLQASRKQYYVRKVAKEWQVSRREARAMIQSGSFPP